ncbi:major outer membrane protein [Helicobacter sp.]|uniref:major outer membrane protein n=1 Tax=Helicobacter sp. TaxID=218 RepID=UPI00258C487A|nr:major outer membrane protein [Helicobacter sp.]MCI7047762.1 major outer membrane protein [Helicobacter sp.]MDY4427228.1 major outer membrane protein [Helicobacter sp.]
MKMTKISLAACIALGSLSTASFAQPLEEAIKGIDVSGMLRYRYTDNRYKDQNFNKNGTTKGNANHQWRAEALFKTPVINNVSMNLGIGYHNAQQNVNHGKGDGTSIAPNAGAFTGNGLGSGSDSWFGVREFNMVITPDSTNTTIKAGKMIMQTPISDTLDDRATGIFVTNSDLNHWTFSLGAFDSWSIDDYQTGYLLSPDTNNGSIDKPLYTAAALSNYDTSIGNFSSQLWLFNATDMIDFAGFGELAWQDSMFHLKGQYAFSKLNSDANSPWTGIYRHKVKEGNDLYTLEAGVKFHELNVPLAAKIGYWGNTQDGYAVSLDNEGSFQKVGQIWFENAATGVSISMLPAEGQNMPRGFESNELSLFYANINYDILENLNVGIDFVSGTNKISRGQGAAHYSGDIDFTEINPNITWQYSKSLRIFAHYSILTTDTTRQIATQFANTINAPTIIPAEQISDSEDRNRLRVEVKYTF